MTEPDESVNATTGAESGPADSSPADTEGRTYGGLIGAFPYAFRQSDSRLFKSYVLAGGTVTLVVALIFTLSVMYIVGETGASATLAFSRMFVALLGLLVVFPLLAPILLVARRHRRGIGSDPQYDRRMAASGYLFLFAMYVGLIPTVPAEYQGDSGGVFAPIVDYLYGLPSAVGLAFPIAVVVVMYLVHRFSR